MHTVTEGQMPVVRTVRVERVGPHEHRRIALRGSQQQHHRVPLGHVDTADRHRLAGSPADQLHRWVVPQRLLDDRRRTVGVGGELVPVAGLAQQLQDRIRDEVHGGLVAGDQQQVAGGHDLLGRQLVAVLLGRDQRRDQVLPRRGPALLDELGEVTAQPAAGLHALIEGLRHLTGDGGERVEPLGQQGRGPAELRLVLDRDAEQPADDRNRQWMREVGHDVEAVPLGDLVEQTVDQRADLALERLDPLRGEGLLRELAQPGVVGRIEEEETRLPERPRVHPLGDRALRDGGLQPVTGRRRMPKHLAAIAERREDDEVVLRYAQRPALQDFPVARVGVGSIRRVEQLHEQRLRLGRGRHLPIVHALSSSDPARARGARRNPRSESPRESGRPV